MFSFTFSYFSPIEIRGVIDHWNIFYLTAQPIYVMCMHFPPQTDAAIPVEQVSATRSPLFLRSFTADLITYDCPVPA